MPDSANPQNDRKDAVNGSVPADAAMQAKIDSVLESIGVYETRDLAPGQRPYEQIEGAGPSRRRRSGGLFVRSAGGGGSPVLNFATRGVGLICFLLLALGAYYAFGGYVRGLLSGPQPDFDLPAATPETIAQEICMPGRLSRSDRLPLVERAPDLLRGDARIPDDPESLREAAARVQTSDGDRVVVLGQDGGEVAVRYAGQSPGVRSVYVNFDEPRALCTALRMVSLVPQSVGMRWLQSGEVVPIAGEPADVFRAGVRLRFSGQDGAVERLQLTRPSLP